MAGSLVGIIISAPVLIVLVLGAGAAALTSSESKAGKVARSVGKVSSDVLLVIVKKWREMNQKYQVADKVAETASRAASRIKAENEKRGITRGISERASGLWKEIDTRTRSSEAPAKDPILEGPLMMESAAVTDGTQVPFDGTSQPALHSPGGKNAPKFFDHA